MSGTSLRWWPLLGSVALFAAGCEANESPDPSAQSPTCSTSTRAIDLSEQTTLGASAQQLLDLHAGTTNGRLDWQTSGDDYTLVLATSSEPADLTVTLAYERGEVRFIEQDLVVPDGQTNEVNVECPDLLEIDVLLRLSTPDGILAETFETTLVVGHDEEADGMPSIDAGVDTALSRLEGSLAVESVQPDTWETTDALRVFAQFSENGSTGRLQTGIVNPEGRTIAIDLAAWETTHL